MTPSKEKESNIEFITKEKYFNQSDNTKERPLTNQSTSFQTLLEDRFAERGRSAPGMEPIIDGFSCYGKV